MTDDREEQLRALALMIVSCRAKATAHGVPALVPLLDRAGLSLSRHVDGADGRRAIRRDRDIAAPGRPGLPH